MTNKGKDAYNVITKIIDRTKRAENAVGCSCVAVLFALALGCHRLVQQMRQEKKGMIAAMRKALAWGLSFAVLVVSLAGAGALLGATASEGASFPRLISNCDTADGWIHDAGNGSVSLDTEVKNEGTGSVKVELTNWLYLMRGVGPESAYDFSGAKYFCFDLWVDEGETDLFTAASDCGINFASDGSYTNGGFAIPAAELKALELHAGWNQVALPLPEVTESVTADITKINTMRLYSTSNNAGRTVRFDNVRLTDSLPEPPTEEDDSKYQFMSNCDDLDGWDFDAGNGSLSLDTEEKRQGSASLKATLTNSLFLFRRVDPEYACDFTGKTYLAFDMWIDEGCEDIFTSAADCGINLTSDGSVDQGGFSIPSQSLKALELKQGWNEIVLPLPDMESESVTADVTKITTMRFYSLSSKAGKVLRFDNFRLLTEEPGDEEDK